MIKKLSNMPYASAKVYIDDDYNICLVSYTTPVIYIDSHGWLECNGTYSRTTIRHIGAFMKEYTPFDYYTAKLMYKDNKKINIFTGEVKPLLE